MKTLTKDNVAQLFHISHRTVEFWVQQGKLPKPTKVGRRALWREDEIQKLLDTMFTEKEPQNG